MKQSGIEETRAESVRTPDPRYFTEGDIPMNPKSIRDNLKKDNMIFSEESIRLIYEMGNMELFELRQITIACQCHSCLRHVPRVLTFCECGVCLRPDEQEKTESKPDFKL